MTTWLFAATATQAGNAETFKLASDEGLIVRPYFANKEQWQSRNHNSKLKVNDILVLVFTEGGQVTDSAVFRLSPGTTGVKLPEYAESKKASIPSRTYPSVFSVFSKECELFSKYGYSPESLDPKLGQWVCLTVVEDNIVINDNEIELAYNGRTDNRATISPVPDHVFKSLSGGEAQISRLEARGSSKYRCH